MKKKMKIEIVEESFRDDLVGSYRQCDCGKMFYNSNGGWDWEKGQLEELQNNSDATDLDYSVGTLTFEGKEYCLDCNCWHKRALMIFNFLISHNYQIAEFFKCYKSKKQQEVDDIKEIEGT